MVRGGRQERDERPACDGALDGRRRRIAGRARGADERLRPARLRLLHPPHRRQGPAARGLLQGSRQFPLEEPEAAGAAARCGRDRQRRRGRRLFRLPPPRQPHRRLGQPSIAAAGEPSRVRGANRRGEGPLRGAGGAAPAALDGLSHHPVPDRILARSAVPPSRPRRIPARDAWFPFRRTRLYPDRKAERHDGHAPDQDPRDETRRAAGDAADRRVARHRPRDRQGLRDGRLAHPVLLAPAFSDKCPWPSGRTTMSRSTSRIPRTRCRASPR